MKKIILTIAIFITVNNLAFSQEEQDTVKEKNNKYGIWSFHAKDVNIHGISVGFLTWIKEKNTNTNGTRLELIGLGIFTPLAPGPPNWAEQRSERINGLSLSTLGTICDCLVNGLSCSSLNQMLHIRFIKF